MAAIPSRVKALCLVLAVFVFGTALQDRGPQRIVSLIPATTEMLFEMGAGDRIAGVSNYDRFPPEVDRLPRVGGLIDPNVERILALKPDLVIVYDTQSDLKKQLERARIPIFNYAHRGLPDITATMRALGTRIGLKAAADSAASRMERQLSDIRSRVAGRARPKTLLVFGHEPGSLRHVDASGGYGFLHDLLEIAGGTDVLADLKKQSVEMSTETILARAPEVVIDLRYGPAISADEITAQGACGTRCRRFPRSGTTASTSWLATSSSCRVRASSWRPNDSLLPCIQMPNDQMTR